MACTLNRISNTDTLCQWAEKLNDTQNAVEQICSAVDDINENLIVSGVEDLTAKTNKQGTGTLVSHIAIYMKRGKVISQTGSIRINGIEGPGIGAHRFQQVLGITDNIAYLSGTLVMNNSVGTKITVGGRILPFVSDNSILECNIPYDSSWNGENIDIQYSIMYMTV